MKKSNIYQACWLLLIVISVTGCYKLQTDYEYKPQELDPKHNMTVKEYILKRGASAEKNDTILKWMQKAIEYSGIDWAEYEKTGRTYILLHTDAIRRLTSGKVTAGFFFDYPVVVKDGSGNPIKSLANPAIDSTRPAVVWEDYSRETVKNILLYLIVQGEYGFDNLTLDNKSVPTLLPANTKIDQKDTRLSRLITKSSPNPDQSAPLNQNSYDLSGNLGSGFDPEGKMNLRIFNNDASPIVMNDRAWARTAGFIFNNGRAHVFSSTASGVPGSSFATFRYSWFE